MHLFLLRNLSHRGDHKFGGNEFRFFFVCIEFWKQVPANEPYRVILGDVRDKLYQTRERSRHLLANGYSDIPEDATFTNVEQVTSSWIFEVPFFLFGTMIVSLNANI